MTLHLPCALRGALSACAAIITCAATAPAQEYTGVEWSQENGQYNGYAYFWSSTATMDTTGIPTVAGTNANNLRPANENTTIGTINSLTLQAGRALLIEPNPYQNNCSFANLTIGSVWVSGSSPTNALITIASDNSVTIGAVNSSNVDFTINANGSLNIPLAVFEAHTFNGSGNVGFTSGTINIAGIAAYDQAGTYTISSDESADLLANYARGELTLRLTGATYAVTASNGLVGTLTRTDTGYTLTVGAVAATRESSGTSIRWNITGGATMDGLLQGAYPDAQTGTPAIFNPAGDALLFHESGTLSVGSSISLRGNIRATSGAAVSLLLGKGATLTVQDGRGALNQQITASGSITGGLSVQAADERGGRLILRGLELSNPSSPTEPAALEKLDIGDHITLELNGSSALSIHADANSFAPTASLIKSGGGALRFIGRGDGSSALDTLANESGTLELRNNVATTHLRARTLSVQGGDVSAEELSVSQNASISAGASLRAVRLRIAGTTTLSGSILEENGLISLSAGAQAASIRKLELRADTLTSSSMSHAAVTVLPPALRANGASVLETGATSHTTFQCAPGTTLRNSQLSRNSTISATGNLTLRNTTHDATSRITITPASGTTDALHLHSVTIAARGGFTVGSSSYNLTPYAPRITMTGTATQQQLTLTKLAIDLSAEEELRGTITLMESATGAIAQNGTATLYTAPGIVGTLGIDRNDNLVVRLEDRRKELLAEAAETPNARAALPAFATAGESRGGVIRELYRFVIDSSRVGLSERRAALSALTAGSVTMLADSQRLNVTDSIHRLRNRVIQMGNPQNTEPETRVHAWAEADGNYHDIDRDGGYAGYQYQAWGGTVGAYADVANFSFGAALSAAWGDLSTHSPDHAGGDHDSYRVSAFARHQCGRWTQMGILSLGRNELRLHRHIRQYEARGKANGHTITGYYEAGYTFSLNPENTQVLQPLASLMLTSARMGQLAESGSIGNAGLCSHSKDYIYGTAGIGARWQVVLAEDVYERLAFLELRARLVQDFGDRTNKVRVNFAALPQQSFTLKGADTGRTGFQFGAGLSVPVGVATTLFADADADFRSGAASVGGSVGVRYQF